ncbi:decapping and exoribonuclease protein [Bicyclus anynana]|uniref:Decapping nuclease n=1 Tax=Bicyclus anynana TaxID=110368 RepID=A0A6J1MVA5_BICAN|nr:decapping and exoribonuclease protein [Bicyclus anynana]XP_052747427.1 decapping and exoribonuclease protein [Bicyclus anynana]
MQYSQDCRTRYICKTLSEPVITGYMSVDVDRQYHSDLSQLKFLNSVNNVSTYLDLNHNINAAVKRSTDENEEKIDLLLKFLKDKNQFLYPKFQTDFITYRRTLISVMRAVFEMSEPIVIRACMFKGSIYLCSVMSTQEITKKKSRNEMEMKFCAWGYKFEQYSTSDQPNKDPDIQNPVIENEEFSLYYYAKLGNFKLLYGAQIDALLTTDTTLEKPKTNDFETNLNYLRNNCFAELKTNREVQTFRQEKNFKKYKLLHCWCQCYLAKLEGVYVGFRNDEGIVERLQWFYTQDIVHYCKDEWSPQIAIDFLDHFLGFVKHSFESYEKHPGPVTLEFQINTNKTFTVTDKCNNDILPTWYTEG